MKVLLIMPNFFNYPQIICNAMIKAGHEVDWVDDRPSTNSLVKAAIRINRNILHSYIYNYFKNVIKKIGLKKYDKVLLISGQSLSFSEKMIAELKSTQIQAEFILYQWDSLNNFEYIKVLYKYFDRLYSFDRNDVENNDLLKFLPLFYSEQYENIGKEQLRGYRYDVVFAGTAHPKKYKYIKEMSEKLQNLWKNQLLYFYLPSRLVYVYRKKKDIEYKDAKYREFHFKPIDETGMIQLFRETGCILDSPQEGQVGLTMRAIEALGSKRKLITANADIENYDFFRKENIYIYDGTFDFSSPFFTEPYVEIDSIIYGKYSLKHWLKVLLYDCEA